MNILFQYPVSFITFCLSPIEIEIIVCICSGEGLLQGGWILFDKEGIPQAAFQENAKKRVPIADILEEVKSMQRSAGFEVSDEKKE